ncbi:uncharacterized protein Bfra_002925 [Botrytis fragariae]|uniref:Uncharacterized protein n=1 Tax=Botrytis fragariae TaxID=1964551 RepID=A0A8H6AZV4_9HELO|nr:uncharacterized protein Bfra_002925 [Botrytis fragariae]KAF5876520.1 hypothetical protein Bfra_002925 [Botrytis fragariae]
MQQHIRLVATVCYGPAFCRRTNTACHLIIVNFPMQKPHIYALYLSNGLRISYHRGPSSSYATHRIVQIGLDIDEMEGMAVK